MEERRDKGRERRAKKGREAKGRREGTRVVKEETKGGREEAEGR